MGLLTAHFLFNLFCSVANCNPRYAYPGELSVNSNGTRSVGDSGYEEYPIVRTSIGRVRGYTMRTISGREVNAFEGIPYAESPHGERRFQAPVPKGKWGGIRNAYAPGNPCLQLNTLRGPATVYGREDCLYLNIYTLPEAVIGERKLPVIFWIHGGSYFLGSGSEFGPAYLLEKDVLLVTINYRLGLLGFLSTGDDVVPGNNGLKDQALALKWVYDNIEKFGGDPSKITVMGHSAGAASVHFHMLNEESRKYIYAGISMSGSALQPWAFRTEKIRRFLNQRLAKELNCPLSSNKFVACLKSINPFLLTGVQLRMFPVRAVPIILFGPVAEKLGGNSNNVPFITKAPAEIYLEGKAPNIPWMLTRTDGEGHIPSLVRMGYGLLARVGLNYIWNNMAPDFLEIKNSAYDPSEAIEKIEQHYFQGKTPAEADESAYDHIITDRFHAVGIQKAIVSHYKVAPTYALFMSGPIRFGLGTEILGVREPPKHVIHADDIFVLFNSSVSSPGLKTTDPEYKLTEIMTGVVTNFANTAVPKYDPPKLLRSEDLADWPAVNNDCHVNYLNVSTVGSSLITLTRRTLENFVFWESLGLDDVPKTPEFCKTPT